MGDSAGIDVRCVGRSALDDSSSGGNGSGESWRLSTGAADVGFLFNKESDAEAVGF